MNELQTRITAAAQLKVNIRYIDRLIKSGKLKAIKIGKLVRIPQTEIDRIVFEGSSL